MLIALYDTAAGLAGWFARLPGSVGRWLHREVTVCRHDFSYSTRASETRGRAMSACRKCGAERRYR